jgi:hypothetical protein
MMKEQCFKIWAGTTATPNMPYTSHGDMIKSPAFYARHSAEGLTMLSVARLHRVEWKDGKWMMNWKVCGRKWSWLNLRYFCWRDWRKPQKNSAGIAGLQAKIWVRDLPNIKQEQDCCIQELHGICLLIPSEDHRMIITITTVKCTTHYLHVLLIKAKCFCCDIYMESYNGKSCWTDCTIMNLWVILLCFITLLSLNN